MNNTDQYILKFNFDKEVALRQNTELAAVVRSWSKDSNELKSETEPTLESVPEAEQFIKLIEYGSVKLLIKLRNRYSDYFSIESHWPNQSKKIYFRKSYFCELKFGYFYS